MLEALAAAHRWTRRDEMLATLIDLVALGGGITSKNGERFRYPRPDEPKKRSGFAATAQRLAGGG